MKFPLEVHENPWDKDESHISQPNTEDLQHMTEQDKILQQKSFHNGLSKETKQMNNENIQNIQVLHHISESLQTDPRLAAMSGIDCGAKIIKATK